jgi:hypothetical protein
MVAPATRAYVCAARTRNKWMLSAPAALGRATAARKSDAETRADPYQPWIDADRDRSTPTDLNYWYVPMI